MIQFLKCIHIFSSHLCFKSLCLICNRTHKCKQLCSVEITSLLLFLFLNVCCLLLLHNPFLISSFLISSFHWQLFKIFHTLWVQKFHCKQHINNVLLYYRRCFTRDLFLFRWLLEVWNGYIFLVCDITVQDSC